MTIPPATPPTAPPPPHSEPSVTHNRNHDGCSHIVLQVGAIHGDVTIHTAAPTSHDATSTATRTSARQRHTPAAAAPMTTTPPADEHTTPLPTLPRILSSATTTATAPSTPEFRGSPHLPYTAFYDIAFRESDSPDGVQGVPTPTVPRHQAIDRVSVHRGPYSQALLRWLSCLAPTPIPLTLIDTEILATSPAFAGLTRADLSTGLEALAKAKLITLLTVRPTRSTAPAIPCLLLHHTDRPPLTRLDPSLAPDTYIDLCCTALDIALAHARHHTPFSHAHLATLLPHHQHLARYLHTQTSPARDHPTPSLPTHHPSTNHSLERRRGSALGQQRR
ncbi:hypothetical protein [Saccharothrix syringae]|uniref:Uncharacterized protein n=1 Tax=Saccharothrix syringae TaxID=103733 RepID=A0A5Q0H2A9_SACSY|nr:hypothetical protein [Saccharothrix syringae]QFZ20387.1 hypothetical protein EKG83_25855 [Saccharothrix syringae]